MAVRSLFPILSTSDLPRLVEFYMHALGATVVYSFPDDSGADAYVSLAVGTGSLGIGADPAASASPSDRVALWFYVDDVDAAHEAALAAGGSEERPPTDMPWGERVSQIRDVDANLVNLAVEPAS